MPSFNRVEQQKEQVLFDFFFLAEKRNDEQRGMGGSEVPFLGYLVSN